LKLIYLDSFFDYSNIYSLRLIPKGILLPLYAPQFECLDVLVCKMGCCLVHWSNYGLMCIVISE